jgi:type I restriction enzyme, S subunit
MNLDKSLWAKVKLGDVVTKIEENDKKSARNRYDRFLKVDHLDTESLHIKRWGSQKVDELPPTFYKIFRKGQILFPTRNPHLRRTALASFDGICGEKTLTLEPNPELICPDFLPFLFHSDAFYAHATSAIIGSTNPHVRWRDIASFEFLLPPKEKQPELSELLWAIDYVLKANIESALKCEIFYQRYLYDSVSGKNSSNSKKWKNYLFGELGQSYGGLSGKTKKDFGAGKPFITYMNVFSNSKINVSTIDHVDIQPHEKQNEVSYGDILITGSSETPEDLGMSSVVLDNLVDHYLNSFCFGFRLNNFEILLPEYARFLMRGDQVRNFMFKHAQGSTRFNLSKTTLKEKLRLKIPTLKEQKNISDNLDRIDQTLEQFKNKIRSSKTLQKALINRVFIHGV